MKNLVFIYLFIFGCMLTLSAKQQPSIKDCVKHPQIVKINTPVSVEKSKNQTPERIVKSTKNINSIPYFSMFNFINFFYTKDTLDNIKVM